MFTTPRYLLIFLLLLTSSLCTDEGPDSAEVTMGELKSLKLEMEQMKLSMAHEIDMAKRVIEESKQTKLSLSNEIESAVKNEEKKKRNKKDKKQKVKLPTIQTNSNEVMEQDETMERLAEMELSLANEIESAKKAREESEEMKNLLTEQLAMVRDDVERKIDEIQENIEVNKESIGVNKGNIEINKESIGVNKGNIEINNENVEVNKESIEVNKGNIEINNENVEVNKESIEVIKGNIEINNENVEVNKESIGVNKGNIEINKESIEIIKGNIEINNENVEVNKESIGVNKGNIEFNKESIGVNKGNIEANNENIKQVISDATLLKNGMTSMQDDIASMKKEEANRVTRNELIALETKVMRTEATIRDSNSAIRRDMNNKPSPVIILSSEETKPEGNPKCARVCAGTSRPRTEAETVWVRVSSHKIKLIVDISLCGFFKVPTITTSIGGKKSHGYELGVGTAFYLHNKSFVVYLHSDQGWDIDAQEAKKWLWNVRWIAVGYTC